MGCIHCHTPPPPPQTLNCFSPSALELALDGFEIVRRVNPVIEKSPRATKRIEQGAPVHPRPFDSSPRRQHRGLFLHSTTPFLLKLCVRNDHSVNAHLAAADGSKLSLNNIHRKSHVSCKQLSYRATPAVTCYAFLLERNRSSSRNVAVQHHNHDGTRSPADRLEDDPADSCQL